MKSYLVHFIFGCILLITPISYTYYVTYYNTEENSVWSPINSQDRLCTDSRFYFSSVMERKNYFFTHNNPVSENKEIFLIDKFRMASYQLMSILTLGFSDSRYAFASSFLLSIVLSFSMLYFCCYSLKLGALESLIVSWVVVNFSGVYDLLAQGQFSYLIQNIKNNILNLNLNSGFENINDSFRYLVLSGANFYIWLGLLWLIWFINKPSKVLLGLLVPLILIIPYTYISVTVLISAIYLGYFFLEFKNKKIRKSLLACVFLSLLILYFIGFYNDLTGLYLNGSNLIGEAHFHAKKEFEFLKYFKLLGFISMPFFLIGTLNKWKRDYFIISVSSAIGLFIVSTVFFLRKNEDIFDRIMVRGGNFIWFFLITVGVLLFFKKNISNRFKKSYFMPSVLFISFCSIQIYYQSKNLAQTYTENEMFQISKDRWGAYEYLRKNSKLGELVFAADFRDIQLLTNFTDLHLVTPGAEFFEKPDSQLTKYVAGLNYLGIAYDSLLKGIDKYDEHEKMTSCLSKNNRIPKNELDTYFLLKQVIYDPYSKKFNGVDIRNQSDGLLSAEFKVEYKKTIYNTSDDELSQSVKYWLVQSELIDKIESSKSAQIKKVYSNKTLAIFKKNDDNKDGL